jgi:HSP20 family molecular chaperone IbpA
MRASRIEMMHDHVRAIHRALTGGDPPPPSQEQPPSASATPEQVMREFGELETLARAIPHIAERVPPFSFAPPLDLIDTERDVIIELGVPGVGRDEVEVELTGETLTVTGARSTSVALDGRIYLHAEMARGPFRREVRLPSTTAGRPRVEVENGVVRVRIAKPSKSSLPQA